MTRMIDARLSPLVLAPLAMIAGCVSSSTWASWHTTHERIMELEERGSEVDARLAEAPADAPLSFASCDDVIRIAVATNPGLAAPRERARAALAMARAEGALPASTVRVATWDFPIGDPSLADREGMYMLSVAQELPPAGHLDGSARAAVEEARAALGELDEMRRMLAAEAAHDCADWAGARARSAALAAWVEVLRSMREAVRARYSAAGGTLADVARIEREIATAGRMVERTLGDAGRAEESLRARLSLAAARELGPAPALPEGVVSIAADAALAYAIEHRGGLAAVRSRIDVAEARASAAEARADVPTLMVGAMYMQTPQMRAGLGLEIGMTLPWLWSGERDEAEARRADARAMEAEAAGLELAIAVEVRGALAELETTRRVLRALRESEAPAAALAFDATAATYGAGEGSLLEWLDAARAIRELELEEAEVLTEVAHARVAVASALGASLAELDAPPLRRAE